MKTKKSLWVALLICLALALASMACNLPTTNLSDVENSNDGQELLFETTLPPSESSEQSSNSSRTISLTEGQINSMIQQALQMNPEQSVQDLQVRLQEGEAILNGTVSQDGFNLPLQLSIQITPDGTGGVKYQITSANVGPFPLPASMRSEIETTLNQNLKDQVRDLTDNIYIERVTITNGVMSVSGRPQ
jgi:uncharacterized protein YpmS